MHSLWDKFTLDHSKSKSDKIPTGFMIFIHALCFVKVSKCLKNAILKNKKDKIKLRHVWTYQQSVVNKLINKWDSREWNKGRNGNIWKLKKLWGL